MRRLIFVLIMVGFTVWGITACKPGLLPTEEAGKPKITVERVDIMRLVPFEELPKPTLMGLGYVFNVDNPSDRTLKLENFKFAVSFEATPGEYMILAVLSR